MREPTGTAAAEYVDCHVGSPRQGTATEAGRVRPLSDDPVLDEPYARKMDLARYRGSGKHGSAESP